MAAQTPPEEVPSGSEALPKLPAEVERLQNDTSAASIPPGTMVVDVRIEGLDAVPISRVQRSIQTRPQREFDPRLVEEDVRRLNRARLFVNVRTLYRLERGGVTVVFQVVERPTFRYVRYVGNEQLSDKKLSEAAEIRAGDGADPYSVEEGRRKIEDLYHEKGFPKAQIQVWEGSRPGDRGVVYLINEDRKQKISGIQFEGNTIASDARLRTQIESKKIILWTFGGTLDRDKIDEDVNRLTNYYRSLGFFQAKIGRELVDEDGKDWLTGRKIEWVTVRFSVREGPRSKVRNISVIGNQKFDTPTLLSGTRLKSGEFFDKSKLDADTASIQEVYGGQGYIYCDVEPETRFLEEPGEVNLVYHIVEGQKYAAGKIHVQIKGDYPHTQWRTMLRALSVRPGDIVDTRELRSSERRIRATGLFNVNPATGPPPQITFSPPDADGEEEIADRPNSRGNVRGQSPEEPGAPPTQRPRPMGGQPRRIAGPPEPVVRGQSPEEFDELADRQAEAMLSRGASGWLPPGQASPPRPRTSSAPPAHAPLKWGAPAAAQRTGIRQVAAYQPQPQGSPYVAQQPYTAQQPYVVQGPQPSFGVQTLPSGLPPRTIAGPPPPPQHQGLAGPPAPQPPAPGAATPYVLPQPRYAVPPAPTPAPVSSTTMYPGQGVNTGAPPSPVPQYAGMQPAPPPGPGGGYELLPGQFTPQAPEGSYFPPNGYLDPSSPSPMGTQPLIITGTEAQTGKFQMGVAVNSNAGLLGTILWDEQNFDWRRWPRSWEDIRAGRAWRGAGQQLRLEAVPGTQVQRYMITFREPYLFDTPISFGFSAFYFTRRYTDWDEQRVGGRVSFGYQFTPDLSGNVALRAEDVNISNPSNPAVPQLAEVLGHNELYAVQTGLVHDTRDSPFIATEGHYINLGFQQAIGSFDYPQVTLEGRQYFMLRQRPDGSGRHVLTLRGETGFSGSDTPIYDNFFIGGFSTIRGFAFRGASPVVDGVIVGGQFMLLASAEYLFPITADDMLRGVIFCDTGTVEPNVELNSDTYRVAAGVGLRISIPALGPAPIALDFAFPINQAPTDDEQIFSFYVGATR